MKKPRIAAGFRFFRFSGGLSLFWALDACPNPRVR